MLRSWFVQKRKLLSLVATHCLLISGPFSVGAFGQSQTPSSGASAVDRAAAERKDTIQRRLRWIVKQGTSAAVCRSTACSTALDDLSILAAQYESVAAEDEYSLLISINRKLVEAKNIAAQDHPELRLDSVSASFPQKVREALRADVGIPSGGNTTSLSILRAAPPAVVLGSAFGDRLPLLPRCASSGCPHPWRAALCAGACYGEANAMGLACALLIENPIAYWFCLAGVATWEANCILGCLDMWCGS